MSSDREYVLGTDHNELKRLELQHGLWVEYARPLWREAGFEKSSGTLLDLGCGPGFTTGDLARTAGPNAKVHAVDVSARFIEHLKAQPRDPSAASIEAFQSPLETLNLPRQDYDGAYCRWLFSFVQDRPAALRSVAKHLRKGARFAMQEYVDYGSMAVFPEMPSLAPILKGIFTSWRRDGGEPDIAAQLPTMLDAAGFRVVSLSPIARTARPGDPLWAWPDSFYRNFVPRMVSGGDITASQGEQFMKDWDAASKSKSEGVYFLAPMVLSIVAEKR